MPTSTRHLALGTALALGLGATATGALLAAPSYAAPKGDPAGNNGTVKIAGIGDIDTIPNNQPHPGCTFTVQWYGFDEGDYHSTVTFELQAPTTDGAIGGTQPSQVFVGEDAAGGAGQDMDAEQVYTLSFTGDPHPQQGYHVKLTVNTPMSKGADKKSKVFWVEGCETPEETPTTTPTTTPTSAPTESAEPQPSETPGGSPTTSPTVLPTETIAPSETTQPSPSTPAGGSETPQDGTTPTVLPAESLAPSGSGDSAPSTDGDQPAAVPTSVDAGAAGSRSGGADDLTWLFVLLGSGLLAAGAAYGYGPLVRGRREL